MNKINPQLQKFAKSSTDQEIHTGKNYVIYTRVSTKEQAETNTSLESQKRYCEEYAHKHDYKIKAYFGGLDITLCLVASLKNPVIMSTHFHFRLTRNRLANQSISWLLRPDSDGQSGTVYPQSVKTKV